MAREVLRRHVSAVWQLHAYLIYLLRYCIGYSKLSVSGMSLTISTTSYSSFLLIWISLLSPLSLTESYQNLVYPKLQRRMQMVVSSSISVSSLTLSTCVSHFLRTKSKGLSTPSISYCPPPLSHCRHWNPPSVSSPIVVKSSLWVAPFYANYLHCSVIVPNGTVFAEFVSLMQSNATLNGGNNCFMVLDFNDSTFSSQL